MWCKSCNIETNKSICPICGEKTTEDVPVEVYWCDRCKVPVIQEVTQADNGICPICGKPMRYLSTDVRPVFPEERLLIEILLNKKPYQWSEASVWAANNRYYVNGRGIALPNRLYKEADIDCCIEQFDRHKRDYPYVYFNKNIETFIKANKNRLEYLVDEAHGFIRKTSSRFPEENIVLSFSGGKDSTVTADLAIKALSNPSLVHIFGNTTLEFPFTIDYVERYRKNHQQAIFKTAINSEQVFLEVCKDIGPPARMIRWCCSMFKTGPISRVINSMYRNQQILSFYGIRKSESAARSKYNRVENAAESVKIQQQTVASPIFFWKDIDIWLYIFSEKIDFNYAYRLGYDRVGCWCCPNNNLRAQFLSKIHMPDKSKEWRDFLVGFAKEIGKPDAEEYIDSGAWKARQGGNGLAAAEDVKIRFIDCATEEHTRIYRLVRPMDDEFLNMLTPFGIVASESEQQLSTETFVLDMDTKEPILSVQPYVQEGYDYAVKVRTINVEDHDDLQHMVGYQVRKFNACRKCLKCEALCKAGAITISKEGYHIDPKKCVRCKMCVTAKYLRGGCLMDKYLRTKD